MEDVFAHAGLVIIISKARWQPRHVARERSIAWHAFTPPDYAHRLALWRHFVRAPKTTLKIIDFETLAGGSIRNIIVGAAFLAAGDGGVVTQKHLLHSTRRELQKWAGW